MTGPNPHKVLSANTLGRDFLMGDLHGELGRLEDILARVNFDTSVDRLISVGDLIDRGPDSLKALALLDQSWFHGVLGNHEIMLLSDVPSMRLMHHENGGEWYAALGFLEAEEVREKVKSMPVAITLEGPSGEMVGICHAEWPEKDWSLVEKALSKPKLQKAMMWGRSRIKAQKPQQDRSAQLLVHGHTPVKYPVKMGSALYIDTGAVYGGALTVIELSDALALSDNYHGDIYHPKDG